MVDYVLFPLCEFEIFLRRGIFPSCEISQKRLGEKCLNSSSKISGKGYGDSKFLVAYFS